MITLALIVGATPGFAQQTQATPPAATHEHVDVAAPLLTPAREASGTSWLPDVSPMYGVHQPLGNWDVRLTGVAFIQALYEPGDRHRTGGASTWQGGGLNWMMFMARRTLGGGRFGVRTMFSAEPWTVPGCGSLSFLATGEVCEGDTIHDRQQPHDLFMELAADYERPLRANWRWQLYGGLAGEPALGPPGYPHRASAISNPIAPMTHHWLEATRVTFGLVTIGVHNQRWKAEWSMFNGREPDESRVDLDLGAFDSIAARLSFLPNERLALQVSAARLREARTDFPFAGQEPFTRITTSAIYYRPLSAGSLWSTTLAFGANHGRELASGGVLDVTTVGGLLETSLTIAERHTLFGRAEAGSLPAHHLHATEYDRSVFFIGKLQFGYVRHLPRVKGVLPGVGATFSLSLLAPELAPRYSGRARPGFGLFFNVQAARHQM